MNFQIEAPYGPAGDQPAAIAGLLERIRRGEKHNVLLGVTGSGKTFTVANVIQKLGIPTLVMSHNKTLAAQLYSELKSFFPHNAVEYFVSYFDYYQPEATSRGRTRTLRRTLPSTRRSNDSAFPPPPAC